MQRALEEAQVAAARGEVPIGAVIVHNGTVIAASGNRMEEYADPTAHAEMLVIREACEKLASPRLPECDLYVTLEPCPMCATAISFARIRRLYFGATDPKSGGVTTGPRIFQQPTCHHSPEIYDGIAQSESAAMLKKFFAGKRS
jgi:tRNA(adenine34) deaminase